MRFYADTIQRLLHYCRKIIRLCLEVISTVVAVCILCFPVESFCQEMRSGESPQHFAGEIKFGPYYPDVDSEFSDGSTPYRDVFGTKAALQTVFGLDWQIVHPPGFSIGIGGEIGFFRDKGQALDPESGQKSGEETIFAAIPMHLDAVVRVDYLLHYTVVPLVPYVKAGISYYLWWVKNESGIAKYVSSDGKEDRALGGTWGWNLQAGLMICLDPLEPRAAKTFDNEMGVNNSYIFGELLLARIDGFGAGDVLNLSDTTWMAGIALEF